jgi:hypothetical protein
MAGKQTKKVLRAWKRFTRRITRGGDPTRSARKLEQQKRARSKRAQRRNAQRAAASTELPPGPPLLARQNHHHVPPQRLNFDNAAQ